MARPEKSAKPVPPRKGKGAPSPDGSTLEQWQKTFRFYLEKEGLSPKQALKLVRLAGSR